MQSFTLHKVDLVDEARSNRPVPIKIYEPLKRQDAPPPLVLWSHGLGGTRDGAGFIARALADHGIMVVNIQHDGTDDCLWRGKPGHPWDNIRAATITNAVLLNRWRDVPFVIDHLARTFDFDQDKIGYSGHSLGALTVQILCGQYWPDEYDRLRSFADTRIRHGLLYSPVPSFSVDHPNDVFTHIQTPILHMTGTNDASPISGYGFEERLRIFNNAYHTDRIMIVINEADHMVFAGSRGQLPGYPALGAHEDLIRDMSLAYWRNAFSGARMETIARSLTNILGTEGTIEFKAGGDV